MLFNVFHENSQVNSELYTHTYSFFSVLIPQQASLSTSNVSSSLVKDVHDAKEAAKVEPRRKSKMASSNSVGFTNLKQGSGYRSSFSGKGLYIMEFIWLYSLDLTNYLFTLHSGNCIWRNLNGWQRCHQSFGKNRNSNDHPLSRFDFKRRYYMS